MLDSAPSHSKQWYEIDYAKAIAILLVIIGHFEPGYSPYWWMCVLNVIYSFHMPLFMFASGFLYIAASRKGKYLDFLRRKFIRLMIPYFATSVIVITIKLLTQDSVTIGQPVTFYNFVSMFYSPSAGLFLWFIWALWWMFVIVPLFKSKKARTILFLASIAVACLPLKAPHIFCLNRAQEMFVYFMFGVMVYDYKGVVAKFAGLPLWVYWAPFIIIEYIVLREPWLMIKYALPYLGIIAILSLSRYILNSGQFKVKDFLFKIAYYSYGLYLFHHTFMRMAKAIVEKLPFEINPDGISFVIFGLFTIICGLIFPILLYRHIFLKSKITRFIFGIASPPPVLGTGALSR